MPGAGFKRRIEEIRQGTHLVHEQPLSWAEEQIRSGKAQVSLVSRFMSEEGGLAQNREYIKWVAGTIHGGIFSRSFLFLD